MRGRRTICGIPLLVVEEASGPPRGAQTSLGHAPSTTMQIYTHVDEEARNQALTGLNDLVNGDS